MTQWGIETTSIPTFFQPPVPVPVAMSLTRGIEPPYDIYLACFSPGDIRYAPELGDTARSAWWTMWESPSLDGHIEDFSRFCKVVDKFDIVFAYDDVTMEALSPYVQVNRLRKLQGGYDSTPWLPRSRPEDIRPRDWGDEVFRFGMLGQLSQRKNPWSAIKAFKMLRERHGDGFRAELHLKSSDAVMHPAMAQWLPGLVLHEGKWSQHRIREFYENLHCYLAPSRGEGKNLPPIEALTTGCPVMVTLVGGHREWFREDFGWVIPSTQKRYALGMGADADVEALADLMWEAYSNRTTCREKGDYGSRTIPAMLDWGVVMRKFLAAVAGG